MTACVDVFVYGTLMSEDIVFSLTHCRFSWSEAELFGFARISQPTGYPYIVPHPQATVRGLVLFAVDELSLAALDRYEEEGCLYHRHSVSVLVNGRSLLCEVYIGDPAALMARFPSAVPHSTFIISES